MINRELFEKYSLKNNIQIQEQMKRINSIPISEIQKFENDIDDPVENPIFGHFSENPEIFYSMIGFSPKNVLSLFLRFEELLSGIKRGRKKISFSSRFFSFAITLFQKISQNRRNVSRFQPQSFNM